MDSPAPFKVISSLLLDLKALPKSFDSWIASIDARSDSSFGEKIQIVKKVMDIRIFFWPSEDMLEDQRQ